jgi:hypothetical protein
MDYKESLLESRFLMSAVRCDKCESRFNSVRRFCLVGKLSVRGRGLILKDVTLKPKKFTTS